MNLGSFTREGDNFKGEIATLELKANAVFRQIDKTSDRMPDFRIYARGAEIGAAWASTSKAGRPYLNVKLDDPKFGAPIFCRLVEMPDGKHLLLGGR